METNPDDPKTLATPDSVTSGGELIAFRQLNDGFTVISVTGPDGNTTTRVASTGLDLSRQMLDTLIEPIDNQAPTDS